MVKELGGACVQGVDLRHFSISKVEGLGLEILVHAFDTHRLWNYDHVALGQPAKHYLANGLAVSGCDCR